jgi:hypothetical protein
MMGDVNDDDDDAAAPGPAAPVLRESDRRHGGAPLAPGQQRRSYDWPSIKKRYVEGLLNREKGVTEWPTLEEVAQHFDLPSARIREKSAMEGWVEQRRGWQAQAEAVRRQNRANAMSQAAVALDGRALDAAKTGLQLCIARLAEIGQQAQANRAASNATGAAASGIDAQEQTRLAQAVDLWHKIGLRAVGDPETHRVEITGVNGQPIEIAAELKRDDPNRITGVLAVLSQAGLGDLFGGPDDADRTLAARRRADGVYETSEARS